MPLDYDKCILQTQELIKNGVKVIYEAGFLHDDVHCFVDLLVKRKDGWHAYEVKSSTNIHNVNYADAALQYWVMCGAGLYLASMNLVHINNSYVKNGPLDIHHLFIDHDVTSIVIGAQKDISQKITELKQLLQGGNVPDVDIGPHCTDPYECDFRSECWKHISEYSIFNIAGMRGKKKWDLYERGYIQLKDIPSDAPLNDKEWQQVNSELNNTTHLDKLAINSFLNKLVYPLYYLDFESSQSAIPLWDNSRPYQQIVFQYSLYVFKCFKNIQGVIFFR